jgi:uncharacterized repeat protein (TIGR03803 family)
MHSADQHSVQGRRNHSEGGPIQAEKMNRPFFRSLITAAALPALLLLMAGAALAQTASVLHSFSDTPDGATPYSGVTFHGGNLFGTTFKGGLYGSGSVYELTPNGVGGWSETTLYSFCPAAPSCTDGIGPSFANVVFDAQGNLYGTTNLGGAQGFGVVFELSPSAGTWTETVLYSFAGQPDAANPVNGLLIDQAGNLYGTAYNGGVVNKGSVFELSPTGAGTWTERVIASVNSMYGGLATDAAGNIFGTTYTTVFELSPNGTGDFTRNTIFTFDPAKAATQGYEPNGTLALDSKGQIFGTTVAGGTNNVGVVFRLIKGSTGTYTEKLIYNFGANGNKPFAGVVLDSSGNLYGTTQAGGKNGAGVVYALDFNSSTGSYTEKGLQAFIGINGAAPYAGLILDSQNYLYGTTPFGGANGKGTVIEVNPHANRTSITLASSMNPSMLGQAVTFTATVTSSAGPPPDGEIVVFQPIGQAAMTGGVATYTTSRLAVGTTNIHALYNGDLNFTLIKSAALPQAVNQ